MKNFFLKLAVVCLFAAASPVLADEAAIEKAEAVRKEAAALGHEWRFTGKWIKQAREALEAGDAAKAKQLAERALFEAETAVKQAATSKSTWQIAVPK